MSKKKRKKYDYLIQYGRMKNKESLNKDFKSAISDIEKARLSLYEADKKIQKKQKRKINKEEAEFYTNIQQIKYRKKLAKKWEKQGFLDYLIELLKEISPLIQMLAKALAGLIIAFLSIDGIKRAIKPSTLKKITHIFDIVMAI